MAQDRIRDMHEEQVALVGQRRSCVDEANKRVIAEGISVVDAVRG